MVDLVFLFHIQKKNYLAIETNGNIAIDKMKIVSANALNFA